MVEVTERLGDRARDRSDLEQTCNFPCVASSPSVAEPFTGG
jgi:hypothetical protein